MLKDIDVLQSYRELRWRMVKMVRNADEIVISEKKSTIFCGKFGKNEEVVEIGRPKSKLIFD